MLGQVRKLSEEIPVVLLAERADMEGIPLAVAERTDGLFWLHEDTPEFVAGRDERLVKGYADQLPSPFFGALKRYVEVDDHDGMTRCAAGLPIIPMLPPSSLTTSQTGAVSR
jgi:hypothetical protein